MSGEWRERGGTGFASVGETPTVGRLHYRCACLRALNRSEPGGAGATRVLCDANAVWRKFDTESAETLAKPNRPDGRLMSAQVTAGSSILLRQGYGG